MLLSFKDFINEEQSVVIDLENVTFTLENLDKVNEDLDAVTQKPFINSALFVNAVRGTLERFGVALPAHSNMQQLSMEAEYTYALGDSGHYVYMVHNLDEDGNVEGYAQIVDSEELEDLKSLNYDNDADMDQPASPAYKPPPARRDDDSGNTDEYA